MMAVAPLKRSVAPFDDIILYPGTSSPYELCMVIVFKEARYRKIYGQ